MLHSFRLFLLMEVVLLLWLTVAVRLLGLQSGGLSVPSRGMLKCLNCKKDADSCCCLTIHTVKENICCNDYAYQNSINLNPSRQSRNAESINSKSLQVYERNGGGIGLLLIFFMIRVCMPQY